MKRRPFVKSVGAVMLSSLAPIHFAKASPTYPVRPVRMIVPLAPGGGSDAIARLLSVHLTEKFGQSFIVENRPAASGIVGTDAVAKAQPDGYTLLTVFSTHAMSAELFKKLLDEAGIENTLTEKYAEPVVPTADEVLETWNSHDAEDAATE